jgi:uncharacterized phage protein gp47/JayE
VADVYQYIIPTGTIIVDTNTILTQVQTEYTNAFGEDLITTPNTPQGVLIAAEVAARVAVAQNNAALANQINPNIAGGVYQDALLGLTGGQRTAALPSFVTANLTGQPGTFIPAGSQARETVNGALFQTVADETLAENGTGSVLFQSVDTGAIPATSGTLTQIVTLVLGWETVTNPLDATLGTSTQSDVQARLFRNNTLALQGMSLPEAIYSALTALPVNSLTLRENIASTTQTIDGVSMIGHSIYLCVDGGTNLDIATILTNTKSGGCGYNNGPGINESVAITVPYSGQIINVLFDRPNLIPIWVKITVVNATSIQNPTTAVQQAILDYTNGQLTGIPGLVIGQNVSVYELGGAVTQEVPGLYVQAVTTSTDGITYNTTEKLIPIYAKATIAQSQILVTVT